MGNGNACVSIAPYNSNVKLDEPHNDIDGELPPLIYKDDIEVWRPLLEEILIHNPDIMHYKIEENVTACMKGGDKEFYQVWGHHHFRVKELVGCQECLEWLHA